MPVNYATPSSAKIYAVHGVRLGTASAAIRKPDRRDLTLIELAAGTTVAGVFTQNRFCAAPVQVCQEHLRNGGIRALVINTGIANAGTGAQGIEDARNTCIAVARLLNVAETAVLPFSTGVIMEPLPVERLIAGLPAAVTTLQADGWLIAAQAIMTTDTVAKAASKQIVIDGKTVTITGISKGAGMIRPNMATMLGFIATDARLPQALLERLCLDVADASFNCISVDGDTSTNDSFILIATGQSGARLDSAHGQDWENFKDAVRGVAIALAQAIVRDGEGATKFIDIQVEGARSVAEGKAVGYAIAHSPLVKTALFASDPNLGRLLAAIGNAGISDLQVSSVKLWLNEVLVAEQGGRALSYREEEGAAAMADSEIFIRVDLARGEFSTQVWTCDLSYDYVKINADYRS